MDFRTESVFDLAHSISKGERSVPEVVTASLDRIEELNPRINAFTTLDRQGALREAAAVDGARSRGEALPPLAGIPIGVKDLEDAEGLPTSYGSACYRGAQPATGDSTLVARLKAAGCIVVGKTNTPEFGWTAKTDNALFGLTKNPWNLEHTPAGSSGGSAAAIASGMVPMATASDGGGSIRIPASACGLAGMKPSYGRVPQADAEAPGWLDLSAKGPLARRFSDVVMALNLVVGPDPADSSSLPALEAPLGRSIGRPLKVLWSPDLGFGETDREVLSACEAALRSLEAAGVEVTPIDCVFDEDPINPWLSIVGACLDRSFAPFEGSPALAEVDPILQMIVAGGAALSARGLIEAIDTRHFLTRQLTAALEGYDLLLCPTTAGVAPRNDLGGLGVVNGVETINWVQYTYAFNMTRSPAASVPIGKSAAGIPIGLQVVGNWLQDALVLELALLLEQVHPFADVAPL